MPWFKQLDDFLRGRLTTREDLAKGKLPLDLGTLTATGLGLGVVYGFFMGWFALLNHEQNGVVQMLSSMVKLPALFFLTLLVTMPSLYVFSALAGSRFGFGATSRLLVGAVVVNLTVAASLGPILGFFTVSTTSYSFMILLNVTLLAIAGVVALGFLIQILRRMTAPPPPPAVDPDDATLPPIPYSDEYAAHVRAKRIFNIWVVLYGLVGMQMGWLLKPFIGDPELPFAWLRPRGANFFQSVAMHLRELLGELKVRRFDDTADFLHGTAWHAPSAPATRVPHLVWWILLAGPLYGAVMGSFSLATPQRLWLVLFSASKVPLLLAVACALTVLPWIVLNTILGLRDDLRLAARAVLAGQAALSVALASLAPLTLVWYGTCRSYQAALVFNGAMFALATIGGHLAARRYYQVLIARDPRHRLGLLAWSILYAFVGIQAAWMLRPFIGSPKDAPSFFRSGAFTNAYVDITEQLLWAIR